MNGAGLPSDVKDFIVRHITSIEQMELLILFAADPGRGWTVRQLVDELRSSESSVNQRLQQLAQGGFVAAARDGFRLASQPVERLETIRRLTLAYREYRVSVIEQIYRRTDPLKTFAEAFKFKPKE